MVQLSSLIKDYKANFGKELRKLDEKQPSRVIAFLNRIRIRDSAIFLHENGAEFINIGITDIGDKFEVVYEYYFRFMKKKYWFIITEVDKKANQMDSIEMIYPSAKNYENEINKRYSLKFISFTGGCIKCGHIL